MTDAPSSGAAVRKALVLGLILVLPACTDMGAGTGSGAAAALSDTYWALLEVDGNSFPEYQGAREPHIVFRSEGERVTGFAGCNAMGGGYHAAGDNLRVGPLALTRMACAAGDATVMESAFVRALDETASYRITGRMLELRDAAGKPRIRLEAGRSSR